MAGPARHGPPPGRGAALPGARAGSTARRARPAPTCTLSASSCSRRSRARPPTDRTRSPASRPRTSRARPASRARCRSRSRSCCAAPSAASPPSASPEWRDLRKAIDALLFSGDFTPTTFDLAFFMHTLFREDMEREARALEDARRGDYGEFLAEEKRAGPRARGDRGRFRPGRRSATDGPGGAGAPPGGDHRGPGTDAGRERAGHRVRPAVSRRGVRAGRAPARARPRPGPRARLRRARRRRG